MKKNVQREKINSGAWIQPRNLAEQNQNDVIWSDQKIERKS